MWNYTAIPFSYLKKRAVKLTVNNLSSPHGYDKQNPVAYHRFHRTEANSIIDHKSSEHMI